MVATKLEFEKKMCELLSELKDNIEGGFEKQVHRITRQMIDFATKTHNENPSFLRGFTPLEWLKQFVNGELR